MATLRKVEKVTEAADHVCDAEKVVKRAARTESGRHWAVLLEGKRFPVPRKCPQGRAVLLDLYEIFRSAGAFPRATRLGGCVTEQKKVVPLSPTTQASPVLEIHAARRVSPG